MQISPIAVATMLRTGRPAAAVGALVLVQRIVVWLRGDRMM
jgi:hypothetical protein